MPLFGSPNVVQLKTRRDIKGLIKALRYEKDPGVRCSAAQALGTIGDAGTVEALAAALKDDDNEYAAEALGKIGDAAAVPFLIAALENKSLFVPQYAAEALGRIGDTKAVPSLIGVLGSTKASLARNAAEALGVIGDPRAIHPLLSIISTTEDPDLRESASSAIIAIGIEAAVPVLVTALTDEALRRHAVEVLIHFEDAAVQPLAAALKDGDDAVQRATVKELNDLATQAWSSYSGRFREIHRLEVERSARLIEGLKKQMPGVDEDIERIEIERLEQRLDYRNYSDRKSTIESLRSLDWTARDAIQQAICAVAESDWETAAQLGAAGADPLLVARIDRELDVVAKGAAEHALLSIGADAVVPLIDQLRESYRSEYSNVDGVGQICMTLLERILGHSTSQMSSEHLHALAELSLSYTSIQREYKGREDEHVIETEHTITVNCSTVNNLARAELARREV